jgi:hypothetical protein
MAMLLTQVPLAPAYADAAPQAASQNIAIAAMFKAYPNGGDALSKQVVGLIMSNPKLAPEIVMYVRNTPTLNRAQKLAAEQGLAAALNQLEVKAADMGVPMVTKGPITPPPVYEDPWFIALSILAVAAATCIAACRWESNAAGIIVPPVATTH